MRAFLPLFVIVVLASSCTGVPRARNDNECLVVIKSIVESDPRATTDAQNGRAFQFELTKDYKPVTAGADYTLIVVREPAVNIKSIATWASGGYRGNSAEIKADIPLPYKPGHVVIADYVFVKKIAETGLHNYMTSTSFRKITDSEREDILNRIKQDPSFASWEKPHPNALKIGDFFEGGIVFYLDGEGDGLVTTPEDLSRESRWDDAKKICKNLELAGFTDWRLPTKNELDLMYKNLRMANLGDFSTHLAWYWSSTEGYTGMYWNEGFDSGGQAQENIGHLRYVRAVRAFTSLE